MLLVTFTPSLAASRARDGRPPRMRDVQCMRPLRLPHLPWPIERRTIQPTTLHPPVLWGQAVGVGSSTLDTTEACA